MPATVLAIGESLVDVVDAPDSQGSPILVEHPGGSPMNIAYGAARLGLAVTLLTAVGRDARGSSIVEHLESAGVVIAPASIRDGETSSATAHVQPDGSALYDFDLRWSLPEDLELPATDIVHVGSIAAFLEPGGSSVLAIVRRLAASENAPVITFDPNMRPTIVSDHASALERFEELARATTVLKLSDEDAVWLYPEATVDEAIDRILALGPKLVAVTRGGEGAVLATRGERRFVTGPRVDVADTIGAGDSFMSALIFQLAGMLGEGVPVAALRDGSAFDAQRLAAIGDFAVRCAAITVSRAGANPPLLAEVTP
ncbi:carbohydrate kinase family protein [Herbiconiux ginsengi]|uniref:Fructokinase n=1 Tax=Herbiconiux ginsengi TaxID=381665 RepID=A0A1H3LYR6_9MICO|nr:carbohydrate kinase [Herbiconiux ginsengi]SDY69550.1 fructokinase [Herbiconiux ginsengi]